MRPLIVLRNGRFPDELFEYIIFPLLCESVALTMSKDALTFSASKCIAAEPADAVRLIGTIAQKTFVMRAYIAARLH
jgi:hypothetical protein